MLSQAAASGALPYANAFDCVRTMVAQEGAGRHAPSVPLGSAPARLLCLLRARPAALGGLALMGEESALPGARPPLRVLGSATSKAAIPPLLHPLLYPLTLTLTLTLTGGCLLRGHRPALALHGAPVGNPVRILTLGLALALALALALTLTLTLALTHP